MLKGENFHNELADPCGLPGDITQINVNSADYAQLTSFGANHVRFDLSWGWYNTSPAFQVVDQHVQLAKQNHLWMYFSLGTTPGGGCDFHQTDFWGNQANQDLTNSFWQDVATHYKNEPTVIGYDILNEPGPPSINEWTVLAQRLRDTITAVDTNHFVIVEATPSTLPSVVGDNIVWSEHWYEDGPQATLPHPAPYLVGEFGARPIDPAPTAFAQMIIDRSVTNGWHWTHFAWREGTNGYGLYATRTAGDFSAPWRAMIDTLRPAFSGAIRP